MLNKFHEFIDQFLSVGAGTVDEARLATAKEGAAHQVHAGRVDDAAVVTHHPLLSRTSTSSHE